MTPAIAPPTTDVTRPPADAPATADLVYVYDPTDPGRNGEVRDARAGLADDLDRAIRAGRVVAYVALDALLYVGPAADFLNVTTARVRQEIDAGRLRGGGEPYTRIRFADLLAYRDAFREVQRQASEARRAIERELGLED